MRSKFVVGDVVRVDPHFLSYTPESIARVRDKVGTITAVQEAETDWHRGSTIPLYRVKCADGTLLHDLQAADLRHVDGVTALGLLA